MSGLDNKTTVVEVTLPGFDGGTDVTDDKVIWIGTRSDRVLQALERYGKVEVTDIAQDSSGIDFVVHTEDELHKELRSRGVKEQRARRSLEELDELWTDLSPRSRQSMRAWFEAQNPAFVHWEGYDAIPPGEPFLHFPLGTSRKDVFNWFETQYPSFSGVHVASRWIVLGIDETCSAAFVDVGREQEVARIIADAADKVRNAPSSFEIDIALEDLNGNRVGTLYTTGTEPRGAMEPATVRLVIDDADHALSRPEHHESLAQLLELVSKSVEAGRRSFTTSTRIPGAEVSSSARFEFSDLPTAEHEGRINMEVALRGKVYLADGVEEGEYRYVIPKGDFEIGHQQDYGDVWLVNAKGDIAPGFENTRAARANCMRQLKAHERLALTEFVQHRISFEDHERLLGNEDYMDECPEI